MKTFAKGMTLVELAVVVAVLGVTGGLAVPVYTNAMEDARSNEARAILNTVYIGQKVYRARNGVYWNPGSTDNASANTALDVDITTLYYDITNVTAVAGTSFTARATRSGSGSWAGRFATIDQNGTYTAP